MGFSDNIRSRFLDHIVNHRSAEEMPMKLVAALHSNSRYGRSLARSNLLAMRGDFELAAVQIANLVKRDPTNKESIVSLGALISQCNINNIERIWNLLREDWNQLGTTLNTVNFPFYALGIDLLLRLGDSSAKRNIQEKYLPFIFREERMFTADREPILYWHVPKTGGTSVSSAFSRSTYTSGMTFIPSYTTSAFLKWLIINNDGALPFLSSAHLSAQELGVMNKFDYVELAIYRNPVERAQSAWRQYFPNPAQRFTILPQHGHIWGFFPRANLKEWCERAPRRVINPWEWTFSGSQKRFNSVDHILPLSELDSNGPMLLKELGFGANSIRVSKNVTSKSIRPELDQIPHVVKACQPDLQFLNALI